MPLSESVSASSTRAADAPRSEDSVSQNAASQSAPLTSPSANRFAKVSKIGSPEPIAALNRIKIMEYALPWEAREPLVDIRTHCPDIEVADRACPYLRRTVADMVNAAQAALPPGYKLKAGSAMRTLSMQKGGWDGFNKRLREEHPEWPLSALRRATNKYFAPYDQPAPPGHCTGGAVDVSLLDASGEQLNLIAPTEGWEAAYTWSDKISPEARANRMLMVETMLGAGFSNCRDEYWHYSYGDSAWAVRVGETTCPYGWTYPPVAVEGDFPHAAARDVQIETRRDSKGRPIGAEGSCAFSADVESEAGVLTPEGAPYFAVGIYYANGINVAMEIVLPDGMSVDVPLYIGDGKENWELIPSVEKQGDRLKLTLYPAYDRAVLTNWTLPFLPVEEKPVEEKPLEEKPLEEKPVDDKQK